MPENQQAYAESIRAMNKITPKTAFIETFGCQQNELDSQRLLGLLHSMGYTDADSAESADLVLLNTCAVREHAELRALGHVGELSHSKKRNPDKLIGLCGCMMQREEMRERVRRSYPQVNFSLGPSLLPRLPEIVWEVLTSGRRVFASADPTQPIAEDVPVVRDAGEKASVAIMTGCDNFCSYCIVPYARGRERSRPSEAVLREVEGLVAEGYTQITLLGQNVNSYRPKGENIDFPGLLRLLDKLPGAFTLDFMTSHPKDAGDALFEAMRDCAHVGNHLHLPFQSGSNTILRAMNRGYTRQRYLALAERAKALVPELDLTSDVIVGFPGETEVDFEDTLDLMRQVKFDSLFTFIYSKRSGTPAAEMPDDTPREVKKERFQRLLALQQEIEGR